MKAFSLICIAMLMQASSIFSLSDYDDDTFYSSDNNQRHQHQHFNSFGNTFTSGSGSSSVRQSNINGNNIIVSRRMGPNDETEDYISITTPKIIFDGDYVSCSTLICPSNTFKCVVTSEAIVDNIQKMKTIADCFDKEETSLAKKEYEEKNPFPDTNGPPYSRHTQVDRDGSINTEDSTGRSVYNSKKLTKEEHKKLMEKVNQQTQLINEQIQQQQLQLQQQMEALNAKMQKTFGNNFPFGNTGFPFPNNFPFYNYPAPYFYYPQTNFQYTHSYNPYPYSHQNQQTQTPNYQPSSNEFVSSDDY